MGNMMHGKGGFLAMVLSILGIVLYVTMFKNIVSAFDALNVASINSNYIAFSTVISIAPTILFLGGIFGAGIAYYSGYKSAQKEGVSGMLMVVLGALEIILFVTMFSTIMTSMESIRTMTSVAAGNYIALQTVIQIAPTILFLGGIFAGGATAVQGWKDRNKNKKAAANSD